MRKSFYIAILWLLFAFIYSCSLTVRDVQLIDDVATLLDIYYEEERMDIKVEVVRQLGKVQDDRALEALLNTMLVHEDARIRLAAVDSLGYYSEWQQFSDSRLYLRLIEMTTDTDPSVCNAAVNVLKDNVMDAYPYLMNGLQSDDYRMRSLCLKVLSRYNTSVDKDPDFIPMVKDLCKQTHETVWQVRELACHTLGALDIESAKPLLYQIQYSDESDRVRSAAVDALNKIMDRGDTVFEMTVAALPLANMTGLSAYDAFCNDFADSLIEGLVSHRVCKVVERSQLDRVIEQLMLSSSDFFNEATVPEIGRLTASNQVFIGSLQKQGNEFSLVVKRVEEESAEVVQSEIVTGYEITLNQMKLEIINQVIRTFTVD